MTKALQNSKANLAGNVLIVESATEVGQWLTHMLSLNGLTCHWARSLEEGLLAIKKEQFHAIITDIFINSDKQPDGLEIIRAVEPQGIPTVIMASSIDIHIAKEAVNHGVTHILEKPFQVEEILSYLQQIWEEPKHLQAMLERFLDLQHLTPKEKEVVRLVLKGLANKEIASVEDITDRTIKAHLTHIFQKCGVATRAELFSAVFPT